MVAVRRRSRLACEIQRYCSTDDFNGMSYTQLQRLVQLHKEHEGMLPARRIVAQVSKEVGLAQTQIRKWFKEQTDNVLEERDSDLIETRIQKVSERIEAAGKILTQASCHLHSASKFLS
ncbi:hypothetical protein PSACC_01008 [Paramicrosporidium saccamoebae]|uniref:Homeobox domain-containing protein n=1 Tax=Paramicrosporidium saccamoebae TaxID=1246581 RepID=A0A2H9TN57_9FUNG|nr:hypothetical protein PSACC_01008 [Paramicrosporidium saccamoebae]